MKFFSLIRDARLFCSFITFQCCNSYIYTYYFFIILCVLLTFHIVSFFVVSPFSILNRNIYHFWSTLSCVCGCVFLHATAHIHSSPSKTIKNTFNNNDCRHYDNDNVNIFQCICNVDSKICVYVCNQGHLQQRRYKMISTATLRQPSSYFYLLFEIVFANYSCAHAWKH